MPLPLTSADRAAAQFITGPNGSQLGITVTAPLTVDQEASIAALQGAVSQVNDDLGLLQGRVDTLAIEGPAAEELQAIDQRITSLDSNVDQRVTALNDLVVTNITRVSDLENAPAMRRLYIFNTRAELDGTGNRYHAPNVYCLVIAGNQKLISNGINIWNNSTIDVEGLAVESGVEVYGNLTVAEATPAMRTYGLTGLSYIQLQDYIV